MITPVAADFGSLLLTLLQDYGLPLAFLVALAWALFTRRLVLGSEARAAIEEVARHDQLWQTEVAFREQLRQEERAGRLAAQERLERTLGILDQHTTLLRDIERELARGRGREPT